MRRPRSLLEPALVLFVFSLFMATMSRERAWGDATTIVEVAENLIAQGRVDVNTRWPMGAPLHLGKKYDIHPILPSLVQLPGMAIHNVVGRRWPQGAPFVRALCIHLGPAMVGALTCLLLFRLSQVLGVGRGAALASALTLGLATSVWVYARMPYTEITQALCFTGVVLALLRIAGQPSSAQRGAWLGVWMGLLINTKVVYVASGPGALVFVLVTMRQRPRDLVRILGGAAVGFLPWALLMLAYNHVRFGSALATGYPVVGATFAEKASVGLWGMFLSPNKSIFLYSPPLVLTLFALPRLWRRMPRYFGAIGATAIPPLLASAVVFCWSGDWAWGPRYAVFVVPALLAPAGLLLSEAWAMRTRARRLLATTAWAIPVLCGVWIQVLGIGLYWDHYIRVAHDASVQWLGAPTRACAPLPDGNLPLGCDACFEDLHAVMWLPPFSPIDGNRWLLRHVWSHDSMATALADAPWRRYTAVRTNITESYNRARLDWWYLDWQPLTPWAPWMLGTWLTLAVLCAAWLVIARPRETHP